MTKDTYKNKNNKDSNLEYTHLETQLKENIYEENSKKDILDYITNITKKLKAQNKPNSNKKYNNSNLYVFAFICYMYTFFNIVKGSDDITTIKTVSIGDPSTAVGGDTKSDSTSSSSSSNTIKDTSAILSSIMAPISLMLVLIIVSLAACIHRKLKNLRNVQVRSANNVLSPNASGSGENGIELENKYLNDIEASKNVPMMLLNLRKDIEYIDIER